MSEELLHIPVEEAKHYARFLELFKSEHKLTVMEELELNRLRDRLLSLGIKESDIE